MTKDEALKLAMEALEEAWYHVGTFQPTEKAIDLYDEARTAIKEALSSCQCPECKVVLHASDCAVHNEPAYPKGECNCGAQPEQEPVATDWERIAHVQDAKLRAMCNEAGGFEKLCEVMDKYERTTPPQRKPLTDEEIILIVAECASSHQHTDIHFARAIEEAHGIKGLV